MRNTPIAHAEIIAIFERRWGRAAAQEADRTLSRYVPEGIENFTVRRCGAYLGLVVACPACQWRPPSAIRGARRWRALAAHMSTCAP